MFCPVGLSGAEHIPYGRHRNTYSVRSLLVPDCSTLYAYAVQNTSSMEDTEILTLLDVMWCEIDYAVQTRSHMADTEILTLLDVASSVTVLPCRIALCRTRHPWLVCMSQGKAEMTGSDRPVIDYFNFDSHIKHSIALVWSLSSYLRKKSIIFWYPLVV